MTSKNRMSVEELADMLIENLASPVRQAVNWKRALCSQRGRFIGAWLWDAELDGGGEKNAKGESAVARAHRYEAAKAVCRACPERATCLSAARSDPLAEGIYGGELINNRSRPEGTPRGHRQGSRGPRLPVEGDDLRDQEDALADHGEAAAV
ncbi:transcriptional regulator WhiB-like [Gordonia phage Pleakley]|uniref:WhiB family transcription factor n=1 Tax=Gordonia phage Pleakley TaxID=2283246 RepID=A0A345M6I0_9CAUD|nr:transcriptional regulator WhiB-like [Gordonia phage Pleakley]AXH49788.1 WhiB family transcription factor [Gordonia phage Fury]AXH66101.1 WhiB family transcription factor [Gordonia phage Pleakley]